MDSSTSNSSSTASSTKDVQLSSPPYTRTTSSPSLNRTNSHGPNSAHRQSFVESLRGVPPSPRHRHPSLSLGGVQGIQDLLNNPPVSKSHDPRFAGRDWSEISVQELVSRDDVKWVTLDTSVEDTTMVLLKNTTSNVVLIRENDSSQIPISTFDYNDLNHYLLVVVGLARPAEDQVELCERLAKKAVEREVITLREIQTLCRKETLMTLTGEEDLAKAMELFGSGIHRFLVTHPSDEVAGVLSQLRLLDFFWNQRVHFREIDELYQTLLRDLGVGSHRIIAVSADSPLANALQLMNEEGLSSVAVVDGSSNVVGNISTADVRHLISASSLPLLQDTCLHFISVILNERGVEMGRDSYPVYHVNPYSTLAHVVAKLVATRSHRMWVVESASPSPSAPATPLLGPTAAPSAMLIPNSSTNTQAPLTPTTQFTPVSSSSIAGGYLSGRLTGLVTLTDILNLFAKTSGLNPADPNEQRARRRRSSSSSIRPSLDASRSSLDLRR